MQRCTAADASAAGYHVGFAFLEIAENAVSNQTAMVVGPKCMTGPQWIHHANCGAQVHGPAPSVTRQLPPNNCTLRAGSLLHLIMPRPPRQPAPAPSPFLQNTCMSTSCLPSRHRRSLTCQPPAAAGAPVLWRDADAALAALDVSARSARQPDAARTAAASAASGMDASLGWLSGSDRLEVFCVSPARRWRLLRMA